MTRNAPYASNMRLAVTLVLVAAVVHAADYTIVRRTTIDGDKQQQTEYWSQKRLVADDPGQRTIVDFAAGRVLVADKDERTYYEIPMTALRQKLGLVGAILEHLPPATRDAMGLGGEVTLAPTANRTTIAGHAADEYGVAGDATGSVWLARDLDPGAILGDDAASWWRAGGPLAIGPLASVARAIGEQRIKGMPMWASITTGAGGGAHDLDSKVVSVRAESPPADVGKVPTGYRKVVSPLGD